MTSWKSQLVENFTPKEQGKDTAQTTINRKIIKRFANRRSDYEGFKRLAFHVSCILLSQFLVYYTTATNVVLHLLTQLFCGYTISFLFMGLHETVHQTAFKTRIWNEIIAYIFGFACFRPPIHYRYYHWPHHRFTGNKDKDPELQSTWLDFDIANSLFNYIAYMSGIPFWIGRITCLLRHSSLFVFDNILGIKLHSAVQNMLLPKELEYYLQLKQRRYNTAFEAFIFVLCYMLLFTLFNVGFLFKYWVLPSIIGQVFLRAYLIAEHRNCASNTNMYSNTRTTKAMWLTKTLAWDMPFHVEHHSFPYVPFYLLPNVHELLVENAGNEDKYYAQSGCKPNGNNGYLSVHRQVLDDIIFNKDK